MRSRAGYSQALRPLLSDGALADLGASVGERDGWTWSGGGAQERIDYALVPRRDAPLVTEVVVGSGPDVASTSDHRPLVVDLWLDGEN